MANGVRELRVFVSSPEDARYERSRLARVVERLNGEFHGAARLTTIRWETEFYKAHDTFQAQIPEAAQCDIVVAIFRARLGTQLPAEFPLMTDGKPYPSGTAYEVLSAIDASKGRGLPDVYVFRFPQPPSVQLDDPKRAEVEAQWEHLKAFFESWFRTAEGQFKAAFQTFSSTDDFEAQVESLLRKWLEEKVLLGRSVVWPVAVKGSPFRGLAAFGAKHAPVFFGRSRDITKATDRLKDAAEKGCPFLLLVGPSGSGKSSLARAGLVPRLIAAGVVPGIDVWRVAVMRPGELAGDPFATLAHQLFVAEPDLPDYEQGRPSALPELAAGGFKTPHDLAALLGHADATALTPILATLTALGRDIRRQEGHDRDVRAALLLVIDQLDELFAGEIGADIRARFAKLVAALARSGRVWIVATLRADLFDRFLAEPQLKQLKDDGASYDLAPPDAAELAEILRGPAAAADLVYETDTTTGERLDERLLNDAGRPDLLPLLQFTLNRLFEARDTSAGQTRLTFAAYRALGGLEGAVDKEAEAALVALGEAERARLPRLLRELVAPARAGLDVRSVVLADAAYDESSERLVRALVDARILLSSGEGSRATVRLAHARVLESWQRAKTIVTENAEFYRIRADVEAQSRRWEAAGRSKDLLIGRGLPLAEAESIVRRFPEELSPATRSFVKDSGRRARLRQTMTAAAAGVFAVVALAAAYAAQQAMVARNAAVVAQRQAEDARKQADDQRQQAEVRLGAADEAFESYGQSQELRDRVAATNRMASLPPPPGSRDFFVGRWHVEQRITGTDATESTDWVWLEDGSCIPKSQFYRERGQDVNKTTCRWEFENISDRTFRVTAQLNSNGVEETRPMTFEILNPVRIHNIDHDYYAFRIMDPAQELMVYQKDLVSRLRIANTNQSNTDRQHDLFTGYNKLADVLRFQGKSGDALDPYRKGLAVIGKLVDGNPNNTQWQYEQFESYRIIGDILFSQPSKRAEALDPYQKGLSAIQKLADGSQGNAGSRHDLWETLSRIGNTQVALGNKAEALAAYQNGLALIQKLSDSDQGNALWRTDLAVNYYLIGAISDAAAAKDALTRALAILEALEREQKLKPAYRLWPNYLRDALAKLA